MALKSLTAGEMISVSGAWLKKDGAARPLIASIPLLAGILPPLEEAHRAILAAQPPPPDDAKLAAISKESAEVDDRHDRVLRGIHSLLNGLVFLAKDGDAADGFAKLLELLLPGGLAMTQKSYREEAGQADLARSRITPPAKKQLKRVPVLGGSLADFVDEWLAKAKRLGELEDERASELGKAKEAAREGKSPQDMVVARNRWIRAANALVANAELAQIGAEKDEALFGPLRLAEQTADRRGKTPKAAGSKPTAGTGEGGGSAPAR